MKASCIRAAIILHGPQIRLWNQGGSPSLYMGNERTLGYSRPSSQHSTPLLITRIARLLQLPCFELYWCFNEEVGQFDSEYRIFLRPITTARGVSAINLIFPV